MNPLVERYLQHVAQDLPKAERGDIEKELRSQIQDQLDDRVGPAPTQAETAGVLAELGDPRKLAASYGAVNYLVGPALYPYLREVLRHGWLIVPTLIMLMHGISALVGGGQRGFVAVFIQAGLQALWTGVTFTGIVVLIFAVLEREGVQAKPASKPFDPLTMADLSADTRVDRADATVDIAVDLFTALVALYFLAVGGLTWRMSLSDPGPVLPVPVGGLIFLIVITLGNVATKLVALLRNRWTFVTTLAETLLDSLFAIGLYIAILKPLTDMILDTVPDLRNVTWVALSPELIAFAVIAISLVAHAHRLFLLWPKAQQVRSTT